MMDIVKHNREAWNQEVKRGNMWTLPVSPEETERAKKSGKAVFLLTPTKHVSEDWYGEIRGKDVLCLASGGGQQGPLFAALGANVTVFDNSDSQLDQDRMVAQRDALTIKTVQGDMRDLSVFPDESFDFIFHPVSNCFIDDLHPVWNEAFRVLRHGGVMIAGFSNPVMYLFDMKKWDQGELVLKYHIPYADTEQLSPGELQERIDNHNTLEYGHTLEDQIGGQLRAGFLLAALYEDNWEGTGGDLLDAYLPTFMATKALKP